MRPTVRRLLPSLHLLEARVEDFDVRAAVIVGERRAVVWDTLAHPDQMDPVGPLVERLPITVVYSHADWDHVWGTCGLSGVEEVVAQEAALLRFAGDVREALAGRRSVDADLWGAVRLVAPTRTFAETLSIDLGDVEVELHALPGHTADTLVGFVRPGGVLLAGDAVEAPLPEVNDAAALPAWVERLDAWSADDRVRIVVPAHGRVGSRELVTETADYLRALTRGGPAPSDLPPFYRETHERNVLLVGGSVR